MSSAFARPWAPAFFESLVAAPRGGERDTEGRRGSSPGDSDRRDIASPSMVRAHDGAAATSVLLEALRAGSRDALAQLYTEHFRELWHIAVLQTRDADAATEVVHDVFLWLWTHHTTIDSAIDLRVYLGVAVRNRARNLARHTRIADTVADTHTSANTPLAMGESSIPSDHDAEAGEFRAAYARAIDTLTEQEQLVVYLRWEEEWSFEQIGGVLSMSKVGARKVLLRAQHKVQRLLAEYHE
jgi:RNA polymerase sigma factor (sigma-70 family)